VFWIMTIRHDNPIAFIIENMVDPSPIAHIGILLRIDIMETWNNRKIPFTIPNDPLIGKFDITQLNPNINVVGNKADIRINDKQAVYQFDGTNWILMEVWALVEDDIYFDKIISPD